MLRELADRLQPTPNVILGDSVPNRIAADGAEQKYLMAARDKLGGSLPQRRTKTSIQLEIPPLPFFEAQLKGSEGREISTTMAFVQMLTKMMRDKGIGKHIVPIVPDESRTFGMEGMFRTFGIYSQVGLLGAGSDGGIPLLGKPE